MIKVSNINKKYTIVKKDIIERNSIKDIALLENIVKYVQISNIYDTMMI